MMLEKVATFKSRTNLLLYRALVLIALGLGCAIFVSESSQTNTNIERHWLLAAVTVLLWPKSSTPKLATLQIVVGLALCCIPIAQACQGRFVLNAFGYRLGISAGILVFVLLLGAHIAKRTDRDDRVSKGILTACVAAFVILIIHAVFMGVLLYQTYGYGYERSLVVLGRTGLLVLACLSFYEALANAVTRRIVSCLLFITFLMASLMK